MSRTFRDGRWKRQPASRGMKRLAAKAARNREAPLAPAGYRRVFCPYDIRDWEFFAKDGKTRRQLSLRMRARRMEKTEAAKARAGQAAAPPERRQEAPGGGIYDDETASWLCELTGRHGARRTGKESACTGWQ